MAKKEESVCYCCVNVIDDLHEMDELDEDDE